jgi:membrane associated rhomboid family serine protease
MFVPLHDHNPRRYVGVPFVTWGLIVMTAAMHLVVTSGLVLPADAAHAATFMLGLVPAVFNDHADLPRHWQLVPELVTPATYMFLHADWMHLLGNILFLWVFGDNVEDAMGHWRFLVFYLLCGIVGGLAFALLGPQASQAPLIGASGAVSGIIAAYLMLYPKVTVWVLIAWRIPIPLTAAWCLGAWIAFQFWQLAFASDTSNVAWLAHIGGLAAGVIFVVILKRGDVPLFGRA